LNLADRLILARFPASAAVGIYDKAYALGAGVKFGLSPFETAWQPSCCRVSACPMPPRLLAGVITYAGGGLRFHWPRIYGAPSGESS
jgi:O-antigen/teichoic acid export membrane protein